VSKHSSKKITVKKRSFGSFTSQIPVEIMKPTNFSFQLVSHGLLQGIPLRG